MTALSVPQPMEARFPITDFAAEAVRLWCQERIDTAAIAEILSAEHDNKIVAEAWVYNTLAQLGAA